MIFYMKTRKIFLPFSGDEKFLKEKWWHRFFTVLFVISLLVVFLIGSIISVESVKDSISNTTIKNNLRSFTQNSSPSVTNTVPDFLAQGTKFTCLKSGIFDQISVYDLSSKAFCNLNISNFVDELAEQFTGDGRLTLEERKVAIKDALSRDREKRYCVIHKDIDCASENIVVYTHNILFYAQVLSRTLVTVYVFSLIVQLIYFKGLIYILYGKK